jgi:predicted enzyme related to lactoylglutathione lyase
MPNPVVHFEINSKMPEKLFPFYRELFDWHIDANNPMDYGMIDTHAGRGINGGLGKTEGPANVIVYVEVDDLEAYLRKVEQLGGKTLVPVTTVPNIVTFAVFTDPEGNSVGLVKSEEDPPK